MSKKSRTKAKEERLKKKRARKQARQAMYERYKLEGRNKKSKRFVSNSRNKKTVKSTKHPHGKCGNIGCEKCHGIYFRPFLVVHGENALWLSWDLDVPHRLWKKWQSLSWEQQKLAAKGFRVFV